MGEGGYKIRNQAAFILKKLPGYCTGKHQAEAGIVEKPEHYSYSSAKDYFLTKKCGLLDLVFL